MLKPTVLRRNDYLAGSVLARRGMGVFALVVVTLLIGGRPAGSAAAAAPPPRVQQLANGMTVIVEERPDALAIGVALVARVGTRDDAPQRLGEVALLARALLGGTPTLPSLERLTGAIEATGGDIELRIDPDLTRYLALVPVGELPTALATLADMLLQPRFGVTDLVSALDDTLSGTYTPLDNDVAAVLWPGHPAGRPAGGTEETLSAITIADLMTLRERYFGARNLTLAVTGAVSAERVVADAEAAFGALPPGAGQPLTAATGRPARGVERMFPSLRDLATVLMAFPTVGTSSPDFAAVTLLGLLLNGPDGLVFQDVRSRHGLARDVDAASISYSDVGAVLAVARVQPQNVEMTVARLRAVFDSLRSEDVSEATLARLRTRYRGELTLAREAATVRAAELAGQSALGTPSLGDDLIPALARVTPADVRRAANTYLARDREILFISAPEANR